MIEPFAGHGGLNHTTPGALGVEDLGMSSIRKIASIRNRCVPALAVIAVCGGAGSASAQDFFSTFFGGFFMMTSTLSQTSRFSSRASMPTTPPWGT